VKGENDVNILRPISVFVIRRAVPRDGTFFYALDNQPLAALKRALSERESVWVQLLDTSSPCSDKVLFNITSTGL